MTAARTHRLRTAPGHVPPPPAPRRAGAAEILDLVLRHRRLAEGTEGGCAARPCERCRAPHRARVEHFLRQDRPIHLVLPAFPAKSPNPRKVLGPLPDLGERLALEYLQSFCDRLARRHRPGARVTVCSDGHVFADAVGVSDEAVTRYRTALEEMAAAVGARSIGFYSLSDAFGRTDDHEGARRALLECYAEPVGELRRRAATDDQSRTMFNGIHRFMFEDRMPLRPDASRTAVREECKPLAWSVIQRSNAWSRLVAQTFPEALRLSIHPQPPHSEKIGFQLLRTPDRWLTPWHGVVLKTGDGTWLTKRGHAEKLRASLVWRDGRPSHFTAPHLRFPEVSP